MRESALTSLEPREGIVPGTVPLQHLVFMIMLPSPGAGAGLGNLGTRAQSVTLWLLGSGDVGSQLHGLPPARGHGDLQEPHGQAQGSAAGDPAGADRAPTELALGHAVPLDEPAADAGQWCFWSCCLAFVPAPCCCCTCACTPAPCSCSLGSVSWPGRSGMPSLPQTGRPGSPPGGDGLPGPLGLHPRGLKGPGFASSSHLSRWPLLSSAFPGSSLAAR